MDTSSRLKHLLNQYAEGVSTEAEKQELMELLRDPSNTSELEDFIKTAVTHGAGDRDVSAEKADEIFTKVLELTHPFKRIIVNRYRWLIAASVTLIVGLSTYFLFFNNNMGISYSVVKSPGKATTIAPASTKATLTLANGTIIPLDSISNESLAQQGGTKIVKLKDGTIQYKPGINTSSEIIYNTISTPKGGQYHVILPDGSHVWLNAASSLTFPASFANAPRHIELKGEAYFEVTKQSTKPFTVKVKESQITVLGTNFNINGYSDEKDINTTLLEGSIKFSYNNRDQLLKPGQQVLCIPENNSMTVQEADITQVMSWKNGFFEFENLELPVIMRQIARWYDVDIIYRNINTDLKLSGGISRKLTLQDLQKLMEANGAPFKIEGRTIIVDH